jgi:hypothetical protein
LEHRRAVADAAQAELAELLRQDGSRPEAVLDLQSYWPVMSMDERREALSQVIQAVFIRPRAGNGNGASPDRVHIVWAADPPVDIPRQGKRGYVRRPFVFPSPDRPGNGRVEVGEPASEPAGEVLDADVA